MNPLPPPAPGMGGLQALYDVPAPAKINLFLHVLGRRPDGYHLLQSPFVLVDWADTLHFERRSDTLLRRHDLGQALPAEDLSLRAARALQQASGCAYGVDIHCDKQLPWGAGLGGGSSDAASTLLALNLLWGLHWPRAKLAALALKLGADVPFFIGGDNAFVEGIGEQLRPIALPEADYFIVKPPASLPTPDIFAHPALVRDTKPVMLMGCSGDERGVERSAALTGPGANPGGECAAGGDTAEELETVGMQTWQPGHGGFGRNDLQSPAQDKCPEVLAVAQWLQARFGNSRMTGSGSAVFARVEEVSGEVAALTATCLAELPPGWVGRACRSMVQHPLKGWAG